MLSTKWVEVHVLHISITEQIHSNSFPSELPRILHVIVWALLSLAFFAHVLLDSVLLVVPSQVEKLAFADLTLLVCNVNYLQRK